METLILQVNAEEPERDLIQAAAKLIREGGLVAFPTETVYGLGANGLDSRAVHKIYQAKGRPSDNPLILHIAQYKDIFSLAATVTLQAQVLMEKFWPGPLTLVLPSRPHIPQEVTAGLATVAIRMPQHPVALALIEEAGVPLAAPSANRSGYPSPTTAQHVFQDLEGRIEMILDGGPAGVGLESTVLDLSGPVPTILRPGGITYEELSQVLGQVDLDQGLKDPQAVPKAPGMKYTHYAPRAQVVLVEGDPGDLPCKIQQLVEGYKGQGQKLALLLTEETLQKLPPDLTPYQKSLGSRHTLEKIAQQIYAQLRACDEVGVDLILTETYPEEGLGTALMNRLFKSAGYHVV